MNQTHSHSWLESFPALQKVLDVAWRNTLDKIKITHISKGDVLFQHGDGCNAYVLTITGCIRVQKIDPQGHEIVLYRVEEGQSCMLTTICLIGGQQYPAEGIAETDATLAILPLADFERALTASSGFRQFVMGSIGCRICDLMQLVEDVAFGRMDTRLARLLIKQTQHHNELHCTHQELAFELGTAREVVSRLLKDFERRGWVGLNRGKIVLCDMQALTYIASQDQ